MSELNVYKRVPLGNICEIISGTTPSTANPEYWNGNVKWITPAELSDDTFYVHDSVRKITSQAVKDCSLRHLPIGTVILSSRAPIGKVAIAATELYCNQGFKNLVCSEKIDNLYLYWFLKAKTDYLNSLGSGATFKEISKKVIEKVKIPLPTIDVQKAIAATLSKQLSAIDTLEEKTERQIKDIEAYIDKRIIEIISAYPSTPKKLGDIAKFEYGYTAAASKKGSHRFVRITDIGRNGILKDEPRMFVEYPNKEDDMNLKIGDILVARTGGTFGKTMVFAETYPAIFASFLIKIKFKEDILPYYYWLYAQSSLYWKQANILVKGGTQPQFNANSLALIELPVIAYEAQKFAVAALKDEIDQSNTIVEKLRKQQENITALRACVFKEAFGSEE